MFLIRSLTRRLVHETSLIERLVLRVLLRSLLLRYRRHRPLLDGVTLAIERERERDRERDRGRESDREKGEQEGKREEEREGRARGRENVL